MTTEKSIPQWAFKFGATMATLAILIFAASLGFLMVMAQDIAVVKYRTERFEKAIEKINDYEVRITVLEESKYSHKQGDKR